MEDRSFAVPPPLPPHAVKPKPRWLWFRIIAGIVGGLLLLSGLFGAFTSPTLEVQIDRIGTVIVTNTGDQPISIRSVIVNGREDCDVGGGFIPGLGAFRPQTLKVGDKTFVNSLCNIVRVTFETDQGSATYSFNR
jgi:hypothetical protein